MSSTLQVPGMGYGQQPQGGRPHLLTQEQPSTETYPSQPPNSQPVHEATTAPASPLAGQPVEQEK